MTLSRVGLFCVKCQGFVNINFIDVKHTQEYVASGTFLGLQGVKEGFELFTRGRCPVILLRGLWGLSSCHSFLHHVRSFIHKQSTPRPSEIAFPSLLELNVIGFCFAHI